MSHIHEYCHTHDSALCRVCDTREEGNGVCQTTWRLAAVLIAVCVKRISHMNESCHTLDSALYGGYDVNMGGNV